jgi:AraC-like DNA-binding protein
MRSTNYVIHEALQPYIQAIIFNEIEIEQDGQQVDLFPVGHAVLSFSLDKLPLYFKDKLIGSFYNMTGQLTQHFSMKALKGHYYTVMVLLKPYGAYRFFKQNQSNYQNHYFDIKLLDADFHKKAMKLDFYKSPDAYVCEIENWLLELLSKKTVDYKFLKVKECVDKILSENGKGKLSFHLDDYGLTKISMERHFKEIVGLLPKQFISITRFNHAYFCITQSTLKNWHDVVSEFNYFDQSHFIKEFKRYCGFTPSQLHQSLYSIAGHVKNLELQKE